MTDRPGEPAGAAVRTLDEAWAAAEAALYAVAPPDESVIEGVSWEKGKGEADVWHARAYRWDAARSWHRMYAEGPTQVAALAALADRLEATR